MGKQQAVGTAPTKAGNEGKKAAKPAQADSKVLTDAAGVSEAKAKPKPSVVKEGGAKPQKAKKSEIDDIFSAGKEKAQKSAAEKRVADGEAAQAEPAKRPRVEGNKDDLFGEEAAKARKRTEEGYRIFTEDELGLGKKGGDTDLCPFDCECCF